MLLKGPRGPGRFGGGGAPRGAGRWPDDILLGAVGLGGGDLGRGSDVSAECEMIGKIEAIAANLPATAASYPGGVDRRRDGNGDGGGGDVTDDSQGLL